MNAISPPPVDIMTAESGTLALLARAEVDMQIATAQRYPRSITNFINETMQMVTLNERIAADCIYALPRDGRTVEGPSARFAEVIASAWGNCRAGARVVNEGPEFITAQGVFHDLQRNVAITYEIQRRITTSSGKRYGADMIGVTGNAASSIALRQAILKGIPKAFWSDMYDAARRMAKGDVKTLANRRADALKFLQGFGIKPAQVFALLEIQGEADITLDHLLTLRGISTAIKEGDTTPEQAFPSMQPPKAPTPPAPPKTAEGQGVQETAADSKPQTPPTPPSAPQAAKAPSPPKPPSAPVTIDNEPLAPTEDATDWSAELEAYSDQIGCIEDQDALVEAIESYGSRFADAPPEIRQEATKLEGSKRASLERALS